MEDEGGVGPPSLPPSLLPHELKGSVTKVRRPERPSAPPSSYTPPTTTTPLPPISHSTPCCMPSDVITNTIAKHLFLYKVSRDLLKLQDKTEKKQIWRRRKDLQLLEWTADGEISQRRGTTELLVDLHGRCCHGDRIHVLGKARQQQTL